MYVIVNTGMLRERKMQRLQKETAFGSPSSSPGCSCFALFLCPADGDGLKLVFRGAGGLDIEADVLFRCFLSLCSGSVIAAGLLLGNLIQHQVSNVF